MFFPKVINEAGEASSSVQLEVAPTESLLLQPQSEQKAKAVDDLEERLIIIQIFF